MELPELLLSFADRAALQRELEENLALGRAFVAQSLAVPVLSECVLVLVHPERGDELRLRAQVVMQNTSGPFPGVGLALTAFDQAALARLNEFVLSGPPPCAADDEPTLTSHAATSLVPSELDSAAELAAREARRDREPAGTASDSSSPGALEQPINSSRPPLSELQVDDRQRRLRQLNPTQQVKLARTGDLADRVAIERLYGKQVWDALLHNPKLSLPEVARIARKGTVPRPLLELIMENAAWLKADAIRRALLSNPKLGPESVLKLLRATSKTELKQIEKGTVYGAVVRESARKLLRQ